MNKVALSAALLVIGTLTACGGGSMVTPPPPPPTVNATVTVNSTTSGPFDLAMSTSFQPAEWDYQFFQDFPGATTPLNTLQPRHIRLQGVSMGIPQTTTNTWDFTILDAITQPVLGVSDNSPEFQIRLPPPSCTARETSTSSSLRAMHRTSCVTTTPEALPLLMALTFRPATIR